MKIITYSDVHLEFGHNWHPPTDIDGDVMLLAADIVSFKHYNPLTPSGTNYAKVSTLTANRWR